MSPSSSIVWAVAKRPRRSLLDDLSRLVDVVEEVSEAVAAETTEADEDRPGSLARKYPHAIETTCVHLGFSPP
jgi:hypothetical protein